MADQSKINKKLTAEIASLKKRIRELETSENERTRAQQALRASEAMFEKILQGVPSIAIQGYGPDGTTVYWNRASERLYGYSESEAVGKNLLDLIIPPEMREYVEWAIKQMAEAGEAIPSAELSLMRKDGSRVPVFSSHVIVPAPGQDSVLFCIDFDLTEHRRVEEALRESEAEFKSLTERMNDILWTVDLDFNTTYVSPSMEKVLGFTVGERMQQHLEEQMPPEMLQMASDRLSEELAFDDERDPERHTILELDCFHKDGSIRRLETMVSFVRDDSGKPIGIHGMSRDITERKRAEEERRVLEATIGAIVDSSPFSIQLLDPEGYTVQVNPAFIEMFGLAPPPDYTILDDPNFECPDYKDLLKRLTKGGRIQFPECFYNTRLNSPQLPDNPMWVRALGFPLFDSEGNVKNLVLMHENITERKHAEEELRESEERNRTLFERTSNPILVIDQEGNYLDGNEAALRFLDCTREELLSANVRDFIRSGTEEVLDEHVALWEKGGQLETEYHVSGTVKTLDLTVTPGIWRNKRAVFGIGSDITERKKVEAQRQEALDELAKYQAGLEALVEERTVGLEGKTQELEEMNAALNVLLNKRSEDKAMIEEQFVSNIRGLVFPYFEKLKFSRLDVRQKTLLEIAEKNLVEILSPLLIHLQHFNLTPREIEVASLIREGKSTKQIAEVLGSATGSIDVHRKNIRRKLGLSRVHNLQSRLQSLGKVGILTT